MIQRFYLDTSVIGGVYDTEFAEHSTILMEKIKLGQVKAVISEMTERKIMKARKEVRDFYQSLPSEHVQFVELTEDAYKLADTYIKEDVMVKPIGTTVFILLLRQSIVLTYL